ncbi:MAG: hypothetical protein ACR2IH_03575 [Pyrinomonadaceae bacterium]
MDCSADAIDAIFERCTAAAPNYGVEATIFKGTLNKIATKFLATGAAAGTRVQLSDFLEQLHAGDLFLATACAAGNERAWWEFDQQHRSYMERVARHLAKTDIDAQEVIDSVYGELYGTRVVDGERVSKFSTYSGRGSMRGWLRTVIWHSLVDLHRASHDEVSLDEMTENVGDGPAHASFAVPAPGGEKEMIARLSEDRYRSATLSAIGKAFGSLDNHEKLLLLYYHVENLKLREIARLVETEGSPLRGWFQRRASSREPAGRIHESTIMRWLEKSYSLVLKRFSEELRTSHALSDEEIDICMEMATSDLTDRSLFENLAAEGNSAAEI